MIFPLLTSLHYLAPGEYYQFVSLGEDGQILIWDLRFPPEKEVGQGEVSEVDLSMKLLGYKLYTDPCFLLQYY